MASNEPIEDSSFSSSLEADLSEQCTTKNNEQLSISQTKKTGDSGLQARNIHSAAYSTREMNNTEPDSMRNMWTQSHLTSTASSSLNSLPGCQIPSPWPESLVMSTAAAATSKNYNMPTQSSANNYPNVNPVNSYLLPNSSNSLPLSSGNLKGPTYSDCNQKLPSSNQVPFFSPTSSSKKNNSVKILSGSSTYSKNPAAFTSSTLGQLGLSTTSASSTSSPNPLMNPCSSKYSAQSLGKTSGLITSSNISSVASNFTKPGTDPSLLPKSFSSPVNCMQLSHSNENPVGVSSTESYQQPTADIKSMNNTQVSNTSVGAGQMPSSSVIHMVAASKKSGQMRPSSVSSSHILPSSVSTGHLDASSVNQSHISSSSVTSGHYIEGSLNLGNLANPNNAMLTSTHVQNSSLKTGQMLPATLQQQQQSQISGGQMHPVQLQGGSLHTNQISSGPKHSSQMANVPAMHSMQMMNAPTSQGPGSTHSPQVPAGIMHHSQIPTGHMQGKSMEHSQRPGHMLSEPMSNRPIISGHQISDIPVSNPQSTSGSLPSGFVASYMNSNQSSVSSSSLQPTQLPSSSMYSPQGSVSSSFNIQDNIYSVQRSTNSSYPGQMPGGSVHSTQVSGSSVHPAQVSGAATHPAQVSGASVHPAQVSGAATHLAQVSGSSLQPVSVSGTSTHPAKVLGSAAVRPAMVSSNSTHLAQVSSSSAHLARVSSNSIYPAQVSGNSAHPAQVSGSSAHPAQVSDNSAHPAQVSDNSAHPAQVSDNSAHPAQVSGNSAHPAQVSGNSAHPAQVSDNSAHPAQVSDNSAHPAQVTGNSAHPAQVSGGSTKPLQVSGCSTYPAQVSGSSAHPAQVSGSSAHLVKTLGNATQVLGNSLQMSDSGPQFSQVSGSSMHPPQLSDNAVHLSQMAASSVHLAQGCNNSTSPAAQISDSSVDPLLVSASSSHMQKPVGSTQVLQASNPSVSSISHMGAVGSQMVGTSGKSLPSNFSSPASVPVSSGKQTLINPASPARTASDPTKLRSSYGNANFMKLNQVSSSSSESRSMKTNNSVLHSQGTTSSSKDSSNLNRTEQTIDSVTNTAFISSNTSPIERPGSSLPNIGQVIEESLNTNMVSNTSIPSSKVNTAVSNTFQASSSVPNQNIENVSNLNYLSGNLLKTDKIFGSSLRPEQLSSPSAPAANNSRMTNELSGQNSQSNDRLMPGYSGFNPISNMAPKTGVVESTLSGNIVKASTANSNKPESVLGNNGSSMNAISASTNSSGAGQMLGNAGKTEHVTGSIMKADNGTADHLKTVSQSKMGQVCSTTNRSVNQHRDSQFSSSDQASVSSSRVTQNRRCSSSFKQDEVSGNSFRNDNSLTSSTENFHVSPSSAVSCQMSAGLVSGSHTVSEVHTASSTQNSQVTASSVDHIQVSASSTESHQPLDNSQVSGSDHVTASSNEKNQVSASSSTNLVGSTQVSCTDTNSNHASSSATSSENCQVTASCTENIQNVVSSMSVDQESSQDVATSSANSLLEDGFGNCDASDISASTTTFGNEITNNQGISSSTEFENQFEMQQPSSIDVNSIEGSEATCRSVKDVGPASSSSQSDLRKTEQNLATSTTAVASSDLSERAKINSSSPLEPTSSSTENSQISSNIKDEPAETRTETPMEVSSVEEADSASTSAESTKVKTNGTTSCPPVVTTSEKTGTSSRKESDSTNRKDRRHHAFLPDQLFEYQWPDMSSEWYILQEQVCEYLTVKSFKRKYPDLKRRPAEMKEKEFLKERGIVTETQCDLGLTALRCEEVYDLMLRDYPQKYQEFASILHERERQSINEKHKGYEAPPKLEKSKMADYVRKAMRSASEFNSQFQRERREERRAYFDLQTMVIHYPAHKYPKLESQCANTSAYPVSLIPGQYQEFYKRYEPKELKYFPLNSCVYGPPKRILNPLVKPSTADSSEEMDDNQDDQADSGSDGDSNDNDSSDSEVSQPVIPRPAPTPSPRRGRKPASADHKDHKEHTNQKKECRVCHKGPMKGRNKKEELVSCSECGATGHPACLDLTKAMVSIIKNYPWQCMECKTCVQCMDPYDEDKMMFCDRCDRGYHTFCVGLKAIPTGRWECTITITSQNQKSLPQTENLLTMLTVGNKDYIRCHYSQIIVVTPWIDTFPHDSSLN
ncbi:uncharacterized protein LOC115217352 isoform X1 [Argonauta hians]